MLKKIVDADFVIVNNNHNDHEACCEQMAFRLRSIPCTAYGGDRYINMELCIHRHKRRCRLLQPCVRNTHKERTKDGGTETRQRRTTDPTAVSWLDRCQLEQIKRSSINNEGLPTNLTFVMRIYRDDVGDTRLAPSRWSSTRLWKGRP